MKDNSYNGWSNYETWNWKLWIDNDEGLYNYWNERATEILRDAEPAFDWQTKEQAAAIELSEAMLFDMDEMAEQFMSEQSGPFADILNAGLGRIDFYEIAENIISDL